MYKGEYSEYNEFNRFQDIDGIEAKIVMHLINSNSKHADILWKILKYDSDIYALSKPSVSKAERLKLVCNNNGEITAKRIFFAPFVDDAWQEQCSSLYIYVDTIYPSEHLKATVGVTVETVVHSKISAISGDGDQLLNPQANPNDSDEEGNVVVAFKNRATVLLKCILAELNGLYLDGVGYMQINTRLNSRSVVEMPLWNNRSFYGHSSKFFVEMAAVSESSDIGF